MSRGTRKRIKEIIELVYFEAGSSMTKKEITKLVGPRERNVHNHLKKLESSEEIEAVQPNQKKFYRPYGVSPRNSFDKDVVQEEIQERIENSIDNLRSRLGDIRHEPELEEIAFEAERSFESQTSRRVIERAAREYGWMAPRESNTQELIEFLKEVIAYKEGFEKSPSYPEPESLDGVKLPPHQQPGQKRVERYIEDNEEALEKIDIEDDERDPSRQDKKRIVLPPEYKILIRQKEIPLLIF